MLRDAVLPGRLGDDERLDYGEQIVTFFCFDCVPKLHYQFVKRKEYSGKMKRKYDVTKGRFGSNCDGLVSPNNR